MKNVLITGASGMIGSLILERCIKETMINEITVFVRKPLNQKHYKVKEVIIEDFLDYTEHIEKLRSIDVVYFCLGAYTGGVSKEQLKLITYNYVKALGEALETQNPNASFCLLSGAGADQSEASKMPFALYKGMAENALKKLKLKAVYLFRPGYIYPVEKRKEPNVLYAVFRFLYPILKGVMKKSSITSTRLAHFIFLIGMNGSDQQVFENVEMI